MVPRKPLSNVSRSLLRVLVENLGHWAGDEQCKVSGGKGKAKPKGGGKSDAGGKKVFTVNHYTGFQTEDPGMVSKSSPHIPWWLFLAPPTSPPGFQHGTFSTVHDFGYRMSTLLLWQALVSTSWPFAEEDWRWPEDCFAHFSSPTKGVISVWCRRSPSFLWVAHFPMGVQDQCCYLGFRSWHSLPR